MVIKSFISIFFGNIFRVKSVLSYVEEAPAVMSIVARSAYINGEIRDFIGTYGLKVATNT